MQTAEEYINQEINSGAYLNNTYKFVLENFKNPIMPDLPFVDADSYDHFFILFDNELNKFMYTRFAENKSPIESLGLIEKNIEEWTVILRNHCPDSLKIHSDRFINWSSYWLYLCKIELWQPYGFPDFYFNIEHIRRFLFKYSYSYFKSEKIDHFGYYYLLACNIIVLQDNKEVINLTIPDRKDYLHSYLDKILKKYLNEIKYLGDKEEKVIKKIKLLDSCI